MRSSSWATSSCRHSDRTIATVGGRGAPANRGRVTRPPSRPRTEQRPQRPARPRTSRAAPVLRLAMRGRVLVVLAAVAAVLGGGYLLARQTSLFSVDAIQVRGAPPSVAAQVRAALATVRGSSLVNLDGEALVRKLDDLPAVASVSYDRAFPHTLRVLVSPEKAVAVLRRGGDAWLVSARARVLKRIELQAQPRLPRIWIPTAIPVSVGETLPPRAGGAAARAVAPLARTRFPIRVSTAVLEHGELVLGLVSHLEVRLGAPTDVRLKLAIARRIVERVPADAAYLDVSVPERPVAGPAASQASATNPQLSG